MFANALANLINQNSDRLFSSKGSQFLDSSNGLWNVETVSRNNMVNYSADSMTDRVEESVGELAIKLADPLLSDFAYGTETGNGSSNRNSPSWKATASSDSQQSEDRSGQNGIDNLYMLLTGAVPSTVLSKVPLSPSRDASFPGNGPTNVPSGSLGRTAIPRQNITKPDQKNLLASRFRRMGDTPSFDCMTGPLMNRMSLGDCPRGRPSWKASEVGQTMPNIPGTARLQLQQRSQTSGIAPARNLSMTVRGSDTESDEGVSCVQRTFLNRRSPLSHPGDKTDDLFSSEHHTRFYQSRCKEYCGSSGGSSHSGSSSRMKYTECVFCKTNGETATMYRSHVLKDEFGRTVCEVLQKYICPLCGATGVNAHTVKYCPRNANPPPVATMTTLKSMRSSTGRKRQGSCSYQALKSINNGPLVSH